MIRQAWRISRLNSKADPSLVPWGFIARKVALPAEVPPIANFRLADDPPGGDNKRYGVRME
jgi:hypothetical protein